MMPTDYSVHRTPTIYRRKFTMIKEAIYKLINHKNLTYEESLAVMGEMMDGTATQAQMGGFLTALRMQGETID